QQDRIRPARSPPPVCELARLVRRCAPLPTIRRRAIHGLESATVRGRRQARAALEYAPEERCVLVSYGGADFVRRLARRFKQALGFFDAQVLHVIDQRESGGRLEATFQRALRRL